MNATRGLVISSLAYLASAGLGTAVAVRKHLPAAFGGFLYGGNNVLEDFLTWRGTALSPPGCMLLGQTACTALALQPGQRQRAAITALGLFGATYTLGQLGEPIVYRPFRTGAADPLPAILVFSNLACSLSLLGCGIAARRAMR